MRNITPNKYHKENNHHHVESVLEAASTVKLWARGKDNQTMTEEEDKEEEGDRHSDMWCV